MADVTTTFAAKDESFAKTVDNLQKRLSGFEGSIKGFTGKVGQMGAAFKGLIGPIAAAGAAFLGARSAVQAFGDAISLGGTLNDLASRTGASAGELMVLQRAFQNAGAGADSVGPTLNRLQRAIVEAGQGSATYTKAFDAMGLSHEQLAKMTPTEQLKAVAQAISAVPNPAERSALAMQILGRSGAELLPFLRNMNGELDTATAQLGSAPRIMDEANGALDALGDNFEAIKSKGMEFALGLLKSFAPALANITDIISKIDFAGIGERLGQAFLKAYDFLRGLFADPSQIFGLLVSYIDMLARLAGDSLITAFTTAAKFLGNLFMELMNADTFGKLGQVLADAFMYGVAKLNLALFEMIESVLAFWGELWGNVINGGVGYFTDKLFDLISAFASDFGQALTNPIGFIAGKLGSALFGSAKESAEAYKFAWDDASGSIIDRAKAGLQAAADDSASRLSESGAAFGQAMSDSVSRAAEKTEIVKSNFFGSAEAMSAVGDKFAAIAEAGTQMREAAERQAEVLSHVPSYAESMAKAYEQAGLNASHIRSQMEAAKGDTQIVADLYTGPSGIATQTQAAAAATQSASESISQAYAGVAQSGETLRISSEQAGQMLINSTRTASESLVSGIQSALGGLTDSVSGFATDATLERAVVAIERLERKLPQPVLV